MLKIIYLLFLVSGCVLFTTPNSANCKMDASCKHSATKATVTAAGTVTSTEEKDIDFNPVTTILAGYTILFN